MKSIIKKILITVSVLSVLGGIVAITPLVQESFACGWKNSGGQGFYQNNGKSSDIIQNSSITKDQAIEIVTQYVKRLNPDLRIGNINDTGPFYEAEILSTMDEEILQVIGVNKQSGQVLILN